MKKLLFIFFSFIFLNANDIQKAFLVAIYDENRVENVQHKIKTDFQYKGEVFFKVAIIGNYNKDVNVITKINKSNGKLINKEALYNSLTKKIYGYELTFRHLDVEKGYFEVFIDGKLYDTKVFVK
ncbi:hypothetical protein AN286_04405 [Aliarcobacter cryaerophilus ATCC 43158]|uniref:Uncharacterized protein n=1 Tax=Aliarcobacter cryaerophilus ATCC 43158 TaxID=1032070 RepID=A0AAD0X9M7_9BACT|nr:hypothetical protein [Aliarcobacter cryaerophilus]AYJ79417.1 hypothetical protein ACRYA_0254 [Aliarcobacter cryaerophilus ATCC 43158]PRM94643.1 hypothetical protein CJ667_09860 [Aliarcobacter cryaerophilus]QCZ23676.1 hypothetical protein AN286_04405 [Aliarcobacter cryaerophilus ATCC 43158]